jgi:hypothetical protein
MMLYYDKGASNFPDDSTIAHLRVCLSAILSHAFWDKGLPYQEWLLIRQEENSHLTEEPLHTNHDHCQETESGLVDGI